MIKSLCCCLTVLVVLFSRPSSETESKSVCQGDYIQMFQNVNFTKDNTINLYINGLRTTLIATWSAVLNSSVLDGYKEKVFLDEFGSVSIRNIQLLDEGTYVLRWGIDMKSEVQIHVMTAPTKYCKPIIKKTENLLTASLEPKECGRPEAYVHWLDYPDMSIIGNAVVKLPPEKEFGTYYACAETLALRCVRNLKLSDYCTTFTIEGNNSPALSSIRTFTAVTVALISAIIFVVLISAITLLIRRTAMARNQGHDNSREQNLNIDLKKKSPLSRPEDKTETLMLEEYSKQLALHHDTEALMFEEYPKQLALHRMNTNRKRTALEPEKEGTPEMQSSLLDNIDPTNSVVPYSRSNSKEI